MEFSMLQTKVGGGPLTPPGSDPRYGPESHSRDPVLRWRNQKVIRMKCLLFVPLGTEGAMDIHSKKQIITLYQEQEWVKAA
jgi:hypothetical protein